MIRFGAVALLWLVDIALLSRMGPIGANPYGFAAGYAAGFGLMAAMVAFFPKSLPPRAALGVIVLLAVAARLAFWPFPPDDDIYRYIWEGHVQRMGFNPYLHAPESPVLDTAAAGLESVRDSINHPDVPAAYPPLSLLIFRLLAGISPSPWLFKGFFLLLDLGTMGFLYAFARNRSLPISRLILYAANPLVIVYVAGEAHLDIIQTFFLAAGLWAFSAGRQGWMFLSLGLAVMAKYLAIAAVPFLLTARNWKKALWGTVPLLLFIPFLPGPVFQSLVHFGAWMHFNDGLTSLLRWPMGNSAPWAALSILLIGFLITFLIEPDPLRGAFIGAGMLLLCLQTLHPWYLLLIAPFLIRFPSPAWVFLMGAMAFTYPVLGIEWRTGVFQETHWIKWLEYVPFYGLLLLGLLRETRPGDSKQYSPVSRISVIVPALNEEDRIGRCLDSIRRQENVEEVIVVDGGSRDRTQDRVADFGARWIRTTPGRGRQVRAGIEKASGDVMLVLHSDSELMPGACRRLLDRLNHRPTAPGGALGMEFDRSGWRMRPIEWMNLLRARFMGISFGDQGQFVRRAALTEMGGFPDLDLMEDVELSLRLKMLGKPIYVDRGVTVSSRRWKGNGFTGKVALVFGLCFRYLIERRWLGGDGMAREKVRRKYYRRYYRAVNREP